MTRNGTHKGGLTPGQELLITALLRRPSMREAAEECGVSGRTAWRWRQKPEFQARYTEARRGAVDSAMRELQGKAMLAVETLARNLTCGNSFAENTAAQAILAHALKAKEQDELIARIERLEERTGGQKQWRA